jgi:hypothetical protein
MRRKTAQQSSRAYRDDRAKTTLTTKKIDRFYCTRAVPEEISPTQWKQIL